MSRGLTPKNISATQMRRALLALQDLLWPLHEPDRCWGAQTAEDVAAIVRKAGFGPRPLPKLTKKQSEVLVAMRLDRAYVVSARVMTILLARRYVDLRHDGTFQISTLGRDIMLDGPQSAR